MGKLLSLLLLVASICSASAQCACGTATGSALAATAWVKSASNPVITGAIYADAWVILDGSTYKLWMTCRTATDICYSTSADGVSWSAPVNVLTPTGTETSVVTPTVAKVGSTYYMLFSGTDGSTIWGNSATSPDGTTWTRVTNHILPTVAASWESIWSQPGSIMWDPIGNQFKLWYSGGNTDTVEPNAVGYATCLPDLSACTKYGSNPIFSGTGGTAWDTARAAVGEVARINGIYYMFYIGYASQTFAQIGIAKSTDGINWTRYYGNPILGPTAGSWDPSAIYKPTVVELAASWQLWYNGRNGAVENIGLANYASSSFGF